MNISNLVLLKSNGTRITNCLHNVGIKTVEDLYKYGWPHYRLPNNFGMKCALSLNEALKENGFETIDFGLDVKKKMMIKCPFCKAVSEAKGNIHEI